MEKIEQRTQKQKEKIVQRQSIIEAYLDVDRQNMTSVVTPLERKLIEAKDNNLILSSTDMDISITDKINCNILEKGSTTINAQTIYDIIRKLPENSEIEVISNNGKLLTLRSGSSRFSLGCLPKKDFPIIL